MSETEIDTPATGDSRAETAAEPPAESAHDEDNQLTRDYVDKVIACLEAGEADKARVLSVIREHRKADQFVFVGVIDPIDPKVETAEEVRDRVLEAAEYIPIDRLGTCDDCGFSPFGDDTSTSRDTAFAKVRARVEGTALAAAQLGV